MSTLDKIRRNFYSDCGQKAYAGAIIGTICGFMFGTMDAAKVSGLSADYSKIMVNLRDRRVMSFFFRTNLVTTAIFGGMFTTYQVARCGLYNYGPDIEEIPQIALACTAGLAPFLGFRNMRRNLPYALVLMGMDIYQGGLKNM